MLTTMTTSLAPRLKSLLHVLNLLLQLRSPRLLNHHQTLHAHAPRNVAMLLNVLGARLRLPTLMRLPLHLLHSHAVMHLDATACDQCNSSASAVLVRIFATSALVRRLYALSAAAIMTPHSTPTATSPQASTSSCSAA